MKINNIGIIVIVLLGLGFALLVSGQDSYSNPIIEGSYQIYNISINNTGNTSESNITQVNITLPEGFVFVSGSNGSDIWANFTNTSNVLSWTNLSGLVMNNSINHFWFNASGPIVPGNYTVNIGTLNESNVTIRNISIFVNPKWNYVVNNTASTNPYLTNQSNTTIYNVTINNTEFTAISNITQVNITLPDGFVFVAGSNGSDIWANFTNTSNVLSWTNLSGLVMNNSINHFWFNATATSASKGNNTMYVNITNVYGQRTTSLIIHVNGPPTVTCEDPSDITTDSATIYWVNSENATSNVSYAKTSSQSVRTKLSDVTGISLYEIIDSALDSSTSYSYWITSCNVYGCSSTVHCPSFLTAADSSSDSSSSDTSTAADTTATSFWTSTFSYTSSDFSLQKNITKILSQGQRIRIKIDGIFHEVGAIRVRSVSATINVSSTPQQAIINVDETKKFDINADSYYEIMVKLNNIINSSANLTISYIHELIGSNSSVNTNLTARNNVSNTSGSNKSVIEDAGSDNGSGNDWMIIVGIIVGVILIAGAILFIIKHRHKRKIHKRVGVKHP